ncbi:bifunctional methionine sulfoxide reductase B/A protein [Legionella londiniensis]|nr:bifunctional methionine sulfoxide reductase B/A protein [Legionella londiniensis]STX92292.1 peptide-methionine (S)-S-oxide reductase [Legionella londiniensis]
MASFIDKTASLTPTVRRIVCDKATEYPGSGAYNQLKTTGTYLCRRCGLALFRAESQFSSGCGWPSFDQEIAGAVKRQPDPDGIRTEILCSRCAAHLGHVFTGEQFTAKNIRHCVNSASLDFVEDSSVADSEEAIVAGGCFWGVEYYLKQLPGVLKVESGYTGGHIQNPDYQAVCRGNTGHYEAVRVLFDVDKTDYRTVIKHFFEIHDPTQKNGQGPDIGLQYQSAIFYYNQSQHEQARKLIHLLCSKGYDVATKLFEVQPFWPAEEYHQNYYGRHHKTPYCHRIISRFD